MLFPETLALIIFLAPLVHLQPIEVSPSDVTNVTDIADEIDCDCDYEQMEDGCVISKAARPGRACKCYSFRDMICWGVEVECRYPSLPSCKSGGDKSLAACLQGGGDCWGYTLSDLVDELNKIVGNGSDRDSRDEEVLKPKKFWKKHNPM